MREMWESVVFETTQDDDRSVMKVACPKPYLLEYL